MTIDEQSISGSPACMMKLISHQWMIAVRLCVQKAKHHQHRFSLLPGATLLEDHIITLFMFPPDLVLFGRHSTNQRSPVWWRWRSSFYGGSTTWPARYSPVRPPRLRCCGSSRTVSRSCQRFPFDRLIGLNSGRVPARGFELQLLGLWGLKWAVFRFK